MACTLDLPTPTNNYLVISVRLRLSDAVITHLNIHFGEESSTAFDALLDHGRLVPDPIQVVIMLSLDDSTLAPSGCSTLYVLKPVPNLPARSTG